MRHHDEVVSRAVPPRARAVPAPSRQLTVVVVVVLASALVAQLVLGWGLLLVAAIAAILAFVDAGRRAADAAADEPYNWALCAIVGLVIVAAVAALYLPVPWGGLVAAVILATVVVLGVVDHRAADEPARARPAALGRRPRPRRPLA